MEIVKFMETKLKDLIPKERPTFYVMVGVPGSGKSTTIKKIQKSDQNVVVVCPDEYRKQLGKSYNYFKEEGKIWNQLCPTDIKQSLSNGKSVIFDATNVAIKRRKSILQWVSKLDVEKVSVVVEVPLPIALRQNQMRDPDKIVPDHVIKNMFKSFVYPSTVEGFDKVINAKEL